MPQRHCITDMYIDAVFGLLAFGRGDVFKWVVHYLDTYDTGKHICPFTRRCTHHP